MTDDGHSGESGCGRDNARIPERCALCQRRATLTFHHLIPRKLHRRTRFKKQYSKAELQRGIYICRPCHSGIHRLYDEMTLAKYFATVGALREDAAIKRHVAWVARQRISSGPRK